MPFYKTLSAEEREEAAEEAKTLRKLAIFLGSIPSILGLKKLLASLLMEKAANKELEAKIGQGYRLTMDEMIMLDWMYHDY